MLGSSATSGRAAARSGGGVGGTMAERRDAAAAGDRIEVGDVTASEAVAVGRGARAYKVQVGDVFFGGPAAQRALRRERENRRRMLARVRRTWVEGVLEPSLRGAARLGLALEARPEAVPDRWRPVAQEAQEAPRPLPPATTPPAAPAGRRPRRRRRRRRRRWPGR